MASSTVNIRPVRPTDDRDPKSESILATLNELIINRDIIRTSLFKTTYSTTAVLSDYIVIYDNGIIYVFSKKLGCSTRWLCMQTISEIHEVINIICTVGNACVLETVNKRYHYCEVSGVHISLFDIINSSIVGGLSQLNDIYFLGEDVPVDRGSLRYCYLFKIIKLLEPNTVGDARACRFIKVCEYNPTTMRSWTLYTRERTIVVSEIKTINNKVHSTSIMFDYQPYRFTYEEGTEDNNIEYVVMSRIDDDEVIIVTYYSKRSMHTSSNVVRFVKTFTVTETAITPRKTARLYSKDVGHTGWIAFYSDNMTMAIADNHLQVAVRYKGKCNLFSIKLNVCDLTGMYMYTDSSHVVFYDGADKEHDIKLLKIPYS
jgi:hypothetical protein